MRTTIDEDKLIGHDGRPVKQPVGGIGEGWGARIAAKILQVGLVGGESSRVASIEEEVSEPDAFRHGRRLGNGFGEGGGRGHGSVSCFRIIHYCKKMRPVLPRSWPRASTLIDDADQRRN